MAEKKVSRKKVNMNAASSNEEENLESGVKEQSLNTAETNSSLPQAEENEIKSASGGQSNIIESPADIPQNFSEEDKNLEEKKMEEIEATAVSVNSVPEFEKLPDPFIQEPEISDKKIPAEHEGTEKDASEEGKTVEIPEASPSNELPKDVFEEGIGEEKKNNNIWLWIVIAIVVIIFLCFCGFIGSIVFLLWG